jgi:protein tyrosine/serine phosphatase
VSPDLSSPEVASERHLLWDGCFNVRDLGGFRTGDGHLTRWGAVVRSDAPDRLSGRGWRALEAHGVRTIVDLRDASERADKAPAARLAAINTPVIDFADESFWDEWRGVYDAPRFYRAVLERWPKRFSAAVTAVARAQPGAVLIHCQVGRDRTGLVAALLLSLVGVAAPEIAADYALSADRLRPLYTQWLREAADETVKQRLERENVSDEETMLALLADLDPEQYLRGAGASTADLQAARARLLP